MPPSRPDGGDGDYTDDNSAFDASVALNFTVKALLCDSPIADCERAIAEHCFLKEVKLVISFDFYLLLWW